MKRQWLDMQYNRDSGYWFMIENGQVSVVFSGECFDLYIAEDRSFPCQLEYAKQWILRKSVV